MPTMVGWRSGRTRRRGRSMPASDGRGDRGADRGAACGASGLGPSRIGCQLERQGAEPLPRRLSVYRALVRRGLIDPVRRKRRRKDYRRWEQGRSFELCARSGSRSSRWVNEAVGLPAPPEPMLAVLMPVLKHLARWPGVSYGISESGPGWRAAMTDLIRGGNYRWCAVFAGKQAGRAPVATSPRQSERLA